MMALKLLQTRRWKPYHFEEKMVKFNIKRLKPKRLSLMNIFSTQAGSVHRKAPFIVYAKLIRLEKQQIP